MLSRTYLQVLTKYRVQGLVFDSSLLLGVLALVRKEIGLDVGVRETILVSGSQSFGSLHVNSENSIFVDHPKQDLSGDVIVPLASLYAVKTELATKAVHVPEQVLKMI